MSKSVIQLLAEEVLRTGKPLNLDLGRDPNKVYNLEQARHWFSCHKGTVWCHEYITDYTQRANSCSSLQEAQEFFDKEKPND